MTFTFEDRTVTTWAVRDGQQWWRVSDADGRAVGFPADRDADVAELATLSKVALEVLNQLSSALAHHLALGSDPCQDRGVGWPCDVALVLLEGAE